MSKTFTRLCNGEPDQWEGGSWSSEYNDWLEGCLRKIVETYRKDYSFLFEDKSQKENQSLTEEATASDVKTESTKSFSSGETAGIGAASATGGVVLGGSAAMGLPVLIKWLLAKFV